MATLGWTITYILCEGTPKRNHAGNRSGPFVTGRGPGHLRRATSGFGVEDGSSNLADDTGFEVVVDAVAEHLCESKVYGSPVI